MSGAVSNGTFRRLSSGRVSSLIVDGAWLVASEGSFQSVLLFPQLAESECLQDGCFGSGQRSLCFINGFLCRNDCRVPVFVFGIWCGERVHRLGKAKGWSGLAPMRVDEFGLSVACATMNWSMATARSLRVCLQRRFGRKRAVFRVVVICHWSACQPGARLPSELVTLICGR